MAFESQADLSMGFELQDGSHVMQVLEREEIRVAVEFMVGREQVFEGFVFIIGGIAIAGAMGVFEAEAGRAPNFREGVAALSDQRVGLVIDPLGGSAGACVAKVSQLPDEI